MTQTQRIQRNTTIIAAYLSGRTAPSLAEEYGMTESAIRYTLKRRKVARRTPEQRRENALAALKVQPARKPKTPSSNLDEMREAFTAPHNLNTPEEIIRVGAATITDWCNHVTAWRERHHAEGRT